jgi:hypothetical protein
MTRAELFRWVAERAAWKRASARAPRTKRERGEPRTPSPRAGKKALYALEDGGAKRSRKSTRRSANRQKTDVQFRMKRRVSEGRAQERPRGTP